MLKYTKKFYSADLSSLDLEIRKLLIAVGSLLAEMPPIDEPYDDDDDLSFKEAYQATVQTADRQVLGLLSGLTQEMVEQIAGLPSSNFFWAAGMTPQEVVASLEESGASYIPDNLKSEDKAKHRRNFLAWQKSLRKTPFFSLS